jgi:hypothetical protein
MRRYIISSVSVFSIALTVCVFASSADAQLFRRGTAPVRPRVPTARNPAMVFPTVPVSQVRFVQGAFNARTGAFAPSASGQYWISSRKGFEPIRGQFAPAPNGPFVLTSRQAFNPATGTFAPSPVGNYIFQQRGILTPNAGNYSQTSTGAFNPQTGAFVPNNKGAFTLSSRGSFVPSNGTFVPFATGNFVLSVRSALDPKTGNFVPSPTGDYNFTSRGAFVPSASFAATNGIPSMPAVGPLASVNPRGTVTPINMPTFNVTPTPALAALRLQQMAALNNAAALSGVNPYLPGVVASSMLTNPYLTAAYAQPPQAGYGGGYGGYSYPPPNAYNPGGS